MAGENSVPTMTGEEIVISGISGLFPAAENIHELMTNLYNKVNMITKDESITEFEHIEIPKYVGKVENMKYFDASFFKIPHSIGSAFDITNGRILEETFSALFDAGVNPITLSGKKIGVFAASTYSDVSGVNLYKSSLRSRYCVVGAAKAMLANRVSYWLNINGPSYTLDSSYSSGANCLKDGYFNIKNGYCEAAIVVGCGYFEHPILAANIKRSGVLCSDGKTKSFDKNGDGYVRSECISVCFMQKAKHAKRIYAEICHIDEKYFSMPDGLFLPIRKSDDIVKFLQEFYTTVGISPFLVEYIEGDGVGLAEADKEELEAVGKVFAKDRSVFIGSLKSNMGHCESAATIAGLIKLCCAYHKGVIPANISYKDPLDVTAVKEGRVKVVTENIPFNRTYTAVNTLGHLGCNAHILLRGHFKPKDLNKYKTSLPRLVLASGRTEPAVQQIIDTLKSSPIDPEQLSLLHDIFSINIMLYLVRGYTLLKTNSNDVTECVAENVAYYSDAVGPVYFMYSGMGSQWNCMGLDLMRIPAFAAALEKCDKVLRPKGVDIIKIISDPDSEDTIFNSFVGISAIQIGLTDVLKDLEIVPDYIIGHSFGEVASAYADGALTLEEAILATYYRGLVSVETTFIKGTMAAVKLGYEEVEKLCPPEIEASCHNNFESTTISGPEDIVKEFIKRLQSQSIFAKEVQTYNIAYHSKYIAEAGPKLLEYLKSVIVTPKLRSEKWLCTSVPPEELEADAAKYASPEYFTNNFLNHVYFEETAKSIPPNAIVIEIAPHGLLQGIVRRSLKNCTHVPLTKKNCESPVNYFLEAIGRLFQAGLNPQINNLYPKVEYPVSTETPMMSSLVSWIHTDLWTRFDTNSDGKTTSNREIYLNIQDSNWKFLEDYFRNDENILPESALLVLVWQTLAMYKRVKYEQTQVIFNHIKFNQDNSIVLKRQETTKLLISIHKGSQYFEVYSKAKIIISGYIQMENKTDLESEADPDTTSNVTSISETSNKLHDDNSLDKEEIYNLLTEKGYCHKRSFKLIEKLSFNQKKASLTWNGNYVSLLDSFIQLHILANNESGMLVPTSIRKLIINVDEYGGEIVEYAIDIDGRLYNSISGAGIMMEDVTIQNILNRKLQIPKEKGLKVTDGELKISYVGLSNTNAKYLNKRIDRIKYDTIELMDYAGINNKGERVMGIMYYDSIKDAFEIEPDLQWKVPDSWSDNDAATVILPYVYAYYSLIIKGHIVLYDNKCIMNYLPCPGEHKVYIANGADVFGQAAIVVALHSNFTVFTTVDNENHKQMLMKKYPLRDEHIIVIRDEYFYLDVLKNSGGNIAVVLSNMSGILQENAIKCCVTSGKFLDISEDSVKEHPGIGMHVLQKAHYVNVNLCSLLIKENFKERQEVYKRINQGINTGMIKPLKGSVYKSEMIQTAVKEIIELQQLGRVIFEINDTVNHNGVDDKPLRYQEEIEVLNSTKPSISGLDIFYNYIDRDIWRASNPMILMDTLLYKNKYRNNITFDSTYLFLIPGFEGHSRVFKSMCKKIQVNAMTMQFGPDKMEDSIPDMAFNVKSFIKKTFDLKSKIYLLGYSFGVNIVLEMAALFEKEGHICVVVCLDSSPDVLKTQIDTNLGNLTDEELQNSIIKHMYKLISGSNPEEIDQALEKHMQWQEKVDMCVGKLGKIVSLSHEYTELVIKSAYKRIRLAQNYKPNFGKLKSEIVLIKGTDPRAEDLPEDYNLSAFAENEVKVYKVQSDHCSTPKDCQVPNIVNSILDPEIVKTFNESNLCLAYCPYK